MASSQVGIPSSSPFGCVLRDHNGREPPCIDCNARSAFHNNFKGPTISIIPVRSDENSEPSPCPIPRKQGIVRHRRRNPSFRNGREENPKAMSRRESGVMDQWVTRQAQETVSAVERNTDGAEILSLSQFRPDNSTSQSSDSPDMSNPGASSLVQMWEARLSRSSSMNSLAPSKTNLGFNGAETDEEATSRLPELCDSAGERYGHAHTNNGDSYPDWESDRSPPSDPPSSQGQDSDAGENERVSVADIIRRLTSSQHGAQNSLMSPGSDNDQEQPVVHPVAPTPRLRGRQAFINLLMQIEHDRRREICGLGDRQAVSRFPHRGRIQAMLRLRFLYQGVAAHSQVQPSLSKGFELGRPQGSTIMLLRERFIEHGGMTDQTCISNSRSPPPNNTMDLENSPISDQMSEGIRHQEVNASDPQTTTLAEQLMSYETEYIQEDTGPSSDACLRPSFEVGSLDSQEQETADRMTNLNNWDVNITGEEEEVGEPNLLETHYDWFSEISRPRRHWEDIRQAWYQEMLESNSAKEEIRQLLERRRVSTSLASDFRVRMDNLMKSLLQKQLHQKDSKREAESEEEMEEEEISLVHQTSNMSDHFNQDTSSLQLPSPSLFRSWNHFQDQEFRDDYDQCPSSSSQLHPSLYPSASQSYNQGSPQSSSTVSCSSISYNTRDHPNQDSPSLQFPSSLFKVWDHSQDQEVRDDSDQVASASSQQHPSLSPSASQSYNQCRPQSSSANSRPSIEMDLIYDLRGQMEQLHHEMAELQKSIRGCMNMQVKLQQLMKLKVSAASHSVGRQGKKSLNSAPRNGNCCICYEMEIDSLLYRCGHMCTCLNCAYELQSSTGKCPICRASIVDVVRAYAHS